MTRTPKSSLRQKADRAKKLRCKNLIAVLESPKNLSNIGTVIRNIDGLGVEKVYVIDTFNLLPKDWHTMRTHTSLNKISVSAVKWSFVGKFSSTQECHEYLKKNMFVSIATSPHHKDKENNLVQDTDFTKKRVAVWFGNEQRGLTDEAIAGCKSCCQIEMGGIIESLNLGTATGIVLHEACKQRRLYTRKKTHEQMEPLEINP